MPLSLTSAYDGTGNLVWLIEPGLEYDRIFYCAWCRMNLFGTEPEARADFDISCFDNDENILNFKTNLNKFMYDNGSAYVSVGHGYSTQFYFFDEAKEIFLVYWVGDGGAGLEYYTNSGFLPGNRLTAIRKIDSEKIKTEENDWGEEEYYLDDASIGGKYALMYGGKFITDFIYEDYESRGSRYTVSDLIDVQFNGKIGIVDKNGSVAIPFLFDDIEFIDDNTAFAKYDGKYGVLALRRTMLSSSPKTGDNISIHIFTLLCISVILIRLRYNKSYKIKF